MAQTISIRANVVDAEARAKLAKLDYDSEKLRLKKVIIKVNADTGDVERKFARYTTSGGNIVDVNRRITKSGKEVASVTETIGKETKKASTLASAMKNAFGLLHTVFLRFAHTAISAVTRSFREALTEMKNVDTQLVTISRVTQTSLSDLDNLKNKAYEVGSAYGVMASDYLSAAAAFSRAGYREQAEDLAELSSKLQVAGQVSADVANQFLIATDKAYQLNGSVTGLSEVMDKLTVIDHNYATSVEKIADGMGIVAPVAAQAHMNIDELIASLGTITAVTQRSGTEAARALRALILSIIKDTTTEIDEGVTWTVEEINSLQDALKLYAPEVVKAAEATGSLIDPMEAIAALAKAYEDGLLTEAKLAEITSNLGGKLRASQLLSLIQNYSGMYTQMMNDMGNAIGAVDKDVDKSLQSWETKLNQLKNTFTNFVSNLLDTDAIKGFIDAFRFLIESISNPEEFTEKFEIAFKKAINSLVKKAPDILEGIKRVAVAIIKTFFSTLKSEYKTILKDIKDFIRKASDDLQKDLPEILKDIFSVVGGLIGDSINDTDFGYDVASSILAAIIDGVANGVKGFADEFIDTLANGIENGDWTDFGKVARKVILFSGDPVTNAFVVGWQAGNKLYDSLSTGETEPIKVLGSTNEELQNTIEVLEKIDIVSEELIETIDDGGEAVESLSDKLKKTTKALEDYKKALKDSGEKGDSLKSYAEAYKEAIEMYEKGMTGSNAYMMAVDLLIPKEVMRELRYDYEKAGELLRSDFFTAMFSEGGDDYGVNAVKYIKSHIDELEGVEILENADGKVNLNITDMDAFAESVGITTESLYALVDALDVFDSATTFTNEEIRRLLKEYDRFTKKNEEGSIVGIDLTGLINQLVADGRTEKEIYQIVDAIHALAEDDPTIEINEPENIGETVDELTELHNLAKDNPRVEVQVESNADVIFDGIQKRIKQIDGTVITVRIQPLPSVNSHASGTAAARGGLSLVNEEGAEIIYANNKAWITGGGDPTITNLPVGAKVFNAKQTREILTRSGINSFVSVVNIPLTDGGEGGGNGGKPKTKSLDKLLEEISEYVDAILKKAREALQEQLGAIDEQIDKLKREHDAEEDANKLEELRLKILEAEQRLAEAQNERTVRYFNKETGQWEWMADQKAVADAQKALQDARDAYDKEVAEQAYDAQIQALNDQKDALEDAYDELEDKWDDILSELESIVNGNTTTDIGKLLSQLLKTKGGGYASGIENLIADIGKYTESPISSLDAETAARILSLQGVGGSQNILSALLGNGAYDLNGNGTPTSGATTNIAGDTVYYINGVQIGSDMMDKPLSQILSVLPIYAN